MAKRGQRKKPSRQPLGSEKQLQILAQLKELATRVGSEVREEKLIRGAGYSVHSGPCRIDGREVVLLDSTSAAGERIDVLVEFLSSQNLDEIYIEPHLRELILGPPAADQASDVAADEESVASGDDAVEPKGPAGEAV
jgi:hypothetical protein